MSDPIQPLLRVKDLTKNFEVGGGVTLAVGSGHTMTFDIQGNYFNLIPSDAIVIVGIGNAEGRIGGDLAANQSGTGSANQVWRLE